MKLEEIEARMHLVGIEPESVVRIVAVEPVGPRIGFFRVSSGS